jgi:Helix-hairpin-helix motif
LVETYLDKNGVPAGKVKIAPRSDSWIGHYRQKQLLAKFHSVDYLRQASLEQIATTPGFGDKVAQIVFTYFHPNQLTENK